MRKKLFLPLLILSLLLNALFVFKESSLFKNRGEKEARQGNVIKIIDGDTFDLEAGIRVRLAGADAPEYPEGCLGTQAKERLEALILGKKVTVEVIEEDNFGRQVGYVEANGLLVDKVMIEEGLAKAANGEEPRYGATLLASEDSAKKAKRGLWSSQCLKEDCLIKGNFRSDKETKVYHLPECYNYEKIVINEREGDQWFCTEAEAKKAGFRKSEDCP